MSVARCREMNARLRAAGIVVHEWSGWESRGNGQTSAYEGGLVHHTATAFGKALPGTGVGSLLVNGRSDLAGPLCNYATNDDGSLTVIAAHPANHAGASGGHSMGPLPVTTLFNKRVLGNEIVYPGTVPMRSAQYQSALIWSRIATDVCGFGDIQRARAHAETSVTGKWDPGDSPGRTINMVAFRAASLTAEDDMQADERNALLSIYNALFKDSAGNLEHPTQGDQSIITRLVELQVNTRALVGRPGADVDEVALATALAPLLPTVMNQVSDDDLARIAVAVNDELHRRQAA